MARKSRNSVRVDASGVFKQVNTLEKFFTGPEIADELQKVINKGVTVMQQKILSDESAPFSSLARQLGVNKSYGRYRTGKMYNSVAGQVRKGPKLYQLTIGYIRGKIEPYFRFQDSGFNNVWELEAIGEGFNGRVSTGPNAPDGLHFKRRKSPKWTEGTYALRDARQVMVDELPKSIARLKTRLNRRTNKVK